MLECYAARCPPHLRDLPALVVPSDQRDAIWVPHLQHARNLCLSSGEHEACSHDSESCMLMGTEGAPVPLARHCSHQWQRQGR